MNLTRTDALTQAVKLAQERGLLPTWMGSAELAEMALRLRERAFFSARTTNAWYLDKLKALVERYVTGEGFENDLAQLRIEARRLLARAGYVPENGFPGDQVLGIPPAEPGSLQDLSSEKRLNLIFRTQADTMRGLGLKLRGLGRAERYPAWELVRIGTREVPREWEKRWHTASDNVDHQGVARGEAVGLRMIALKTSQIWQALGSTALFEDALNVDHPPFAFGSGMGWREVPAEEAADFGLSISGARVDGMNVVPPMQPREPAPGLSEAERSAKLARFQKLAAKFKQIDARG